MRGKLLSFLLMALVVVSYIACDKALIPVPPQGTDLNPGSDDRVGDYITSGKFSDGRLIAAYFNETKGSLEVAIEKSANSGQFDKPQPIESPHGTNGLHNSLVVLPDDSVEILTYNDTKGRLEQVSYREGTFSEPQFITHNQDHKIGMWNCIDIDDDNTLHASFYDNRGNLMYGVRKQEEQDWTFARVVEEKPGVDPFTSRFAQQPDIGRYSKIKAGKGGEVYIAFYNATHADAYLATFKPEFNADDGLLVVTPTNDILAKFTAIDTDGDVGSWMAMVLDANHQPILFYYDATRGDLKGAWLGGERPKIKVIDNTGNVGMDISCRRDANGRIHLAYLAVDSFDLRYWVEGSEPKTLDANGITGFWTALEVTDTGYRIFYNLSHSRNAISGDTQQEKVLVWPPVGTQSI